MSTTKPYYVGVDWDSGSWLAVGYHPDEGFTATAESEIDSIWNRYETADRIVIDVPIGLCGSRYDEDPAGVRDDDGELVRICDLLARSILDGVRSSSVFNAPARRAVEMAVNGAAYQDVNQLNKCLTGKGLSQQSATLAGGIHTVDQLLKKEDASIDL